MAFSGVKNPLQRKSYMGILAFLVSATASAAGMGTIPTDKYEKVSKAEPTYFELVGVNATDATMSDVKATPAGVTAFNTPDPVVEKAATEEKPAVSYDVVELDDVPSIVRGSNKSEAYPFSTLAAPKPKFQADGVTPVMKDGKQAMTYAAFFVPATTARPNPSRALASTAKGAEKRIGGGVEFTVRKAYAADRVTITGAHVLRTK